MTEKLTFIAFYPHSPDRVWRALTDSKLLGDWLLPNDFEPTVGSKFKFQARDHSKAPKIEGTVIEVEDGRMLSYTWLDSEDGQAGTPSRVTWKLRPRDGGTELRLEHLPADYVAPIVLLEAALNWRFALFGSLAELLRRGPRVPIVYAIDEPEPPEVAARRAGFRQEPVGVEARK